MIMLRNFILLLFFLSSGPWAHAAYTPFNTSGIGNIGVGTSTPQAKFVVVSGNVGIGTWTATGGNLIVNGGGNVGIGSVWPGAALDVQGTVRTIGFTMSGQTPVSGYVLTASDSSGDTTWTSSGTVSGWTSGAGTLYTTTGSNNVGIGTTTPQGGLVVTNGNVGIGTWAPGALMQIGGVETLSNGSATTSLLVTSGQLFVSNLKSGTPLNEFTFDSNGTNFGHFYEDGTSDDYLFLGGSNSNSVPVNPVMAWGLNSGNVGIGSMAPGQVLDVQGTVRNLGEIVNGNVGIGTSTPQSALVVTNGNLGIGTWTASTNQLSVIGRASIGSAVYNNTLGPINGLIISGPVGVGTLNPLDSTNMSGQFPVFAVKGGYSNLNGLRISGGDTGNTVYSASSIGIASDVNIRLGGNSSAGIVNVVTTTGNVGIGTNTPQGGLVVTNGNVGIGTWAPVHTFQVGAYNSSSSGFEIDANGNVGIGTTITSNASLSIMNGNVGIGTYNPVKTLEVNGTIQADFEYEYPGGFGPLADNSGNLYVPEELLDGTNSPGTSGDCLTSTGTQIAWGSCSGSVGMGTGYPSSPYNSVQFNDVGNFGGSANFVFNGNNVGIGTVLSKNTLDIANNVSIGTAYAGNKAAPTNGLIVQGNVGMGTWTVLNALDVSGGAAYGTYGGEQTAPSNGIAVSGNVGIGTWVPGNKLQVSGSGGSNVDFAVNGRMQTGDVGNDGGIWLNSGQSLFVGQEAATTLGFYNNTAWRLVVDSSGNTGISISAPNALLSLGLGVTTIKAAVYDGGAGSLYGMGVNAGELTFGASIAVNGTPQMVLTNGGNVGIASTAPGQKLDVQGTIRTTNFTMSGQTPVSGYVLTASDSSGDTTWTSSGTVSGWTSGAGTLYTTTGSNNVGIGTTTPQGGLVVTNGNVGIGTWAPTGGSLIVNGNVGIGTVNANNNLEVNGTEELSGNLVFKGLTYNGTTGSTGNLVSSAQPVLTSPRIALLLGGTNVGSNITIEGTSAASPNTTSGIIFNYGASAVSEDFHQIGSSGNIGIGSWSSNTSNLNNTFEVIGNIGIGTNASSNYVNTSAPNGGMIVQGNVGIGSVNPGVALDVQGSVRMTGLTLTGNGAGNGNVLVTNSVGLGTWMPASTLPVSGVISGLTTGTIPQAANSTSLSDSVITQSSGNIGIGVGSPTAPLEVNGSIVADGSGNSYFSSGNLGVGTITPQAAFVVTDGNVGIGTWTATSGLQIKQSFAVYRTSTAISAASAGQTIIGVTDTSSARTITLSSADTMPGRIVIIKDESGAAGTNNITINTESGQTIDGVLSVVISVNYGVLRVYSNGTNWFTF